MKTNLIQKWTLAAAVAALAIFAENVQAQNTAAVPQLTESSAQVLKLAQAKVGDDTILAFINSSRASYNLTADQIIYLKEQGVSTAAINAMLTQPNSALTAAGTAMPQTAPQTLPQPAAVSATAPAPTVYSSPTEVQQPAITVVETAPATTVYYSDPYYYPAYYGWGGYPVVGFSWGWGGGWHGGWGGWHGGGWGGGWHGGGGGWHGGGGFHGGHR